ncbi:MAG: Nif3-like dinuclear metal center hexameric protein, partial [Candidatus Nanoarchaeia archaeon]
LKRLTGYNASMLSKLFSYNISLYAAHLPLDANPKIGHNILIAKMLSLKNIAKFAKYAGYEIGFMGTAPKGATTAKFAEILKRNLGSSSIRVIGDAEKEIHRCGIVSGGGADCIQDALDNGLDCFVTGEIGHSNYHIIKDSGIRVIVAGHYCTEKPGIFAVMKEIQKKFKIECEFIDIPTGM